jgi:hypothetical protein
VALLFGLGPRLDDWEKLTLVVGDKQTRAAGTFQLFEQC